MSHFRPAFSLLLLGYLISGAGCEKPAPPPALPPAAPPAPPAAPPMPPPIQAAAPVDPVKAIPDIPWKMVDKKKALAENPMWIVTENKIKIDDPVTFAGSAYFSAISQTTVNTLMYDLRLQKELNDGKFPTFEVYSGMLKMHNVPLKGLKPWQVYAYDDTDGSVTILEDKEAQREAYKKVGLELKD